MVGATAAFVSNDAIMRSVSQELPAGQMIFLRSVLAATLVLLLVLATGVGRQLRHLAQPRLAARALADAFGTTCYLVSLFHLPLANATAINLAAPLFMVVFAIWFLRERPSAARWAAVGIGFAGVLCVVQPSGDGFNAWALLCLLGTVLHAARDLLTRHIDRTVPSLVVTLSSAIGVALVSAGLSVTQGWQAASAQQLGQLGASAVLLVCGYLLIVQCLRLGEVSLTAPFRYSSLLFAVVLGYVVFGDVPNAWAWCGIALLLGSGLFVLLGERGRRPATAPIAK
jgi:drug/metabolite transporter (DMT)-like permease